MLLLLASSCASSRGIRLYQLSSPDLRGPDEQSVGTVVVAPRLTAGKITVNGNLRASDVKNAVGALSKAALELCLLRAAFKSNTLLPDPGKATARFRINGKGLVSRVRVLGAKGKFRRCIAKVFGELRFPRAKTGRPASVSYGLHWRLVQPGSRRTGSHGQTTRPPRVQIGAATNVGDLGKDTIRRYIRKELKDITLCYERQLGKLRRVGEQEVVGVFE